MAWGRGIDHIHVHTTATLRTDHDTHSPYGEGKGYIHTDAFLHCAAVRALVGAV